MGEGSLFDIDPNASKPQTISTPIPPFKKPDVIYTPIIQPVRDSGGFSPVDPELARIGLNESFPAYETKLEDHRNVTPIPQEKHWSDNILKQDYKIDQWEVKPASVKEAPEVYKCGKFGKIYKDPKQKVGNKDIWWSKNTAGHSGQSQGLLPSAYKLFIKTAEHFKWIGDADATGKVIENKNKSEIGKEIKISKCNKVK